MEFNFSRRALTTVLRMVPLFLREPPVSVHQYRLQTLVSGTVNPTDRIIRHGKQMGRLVQVASMHLTVLLNRPDVLATHRLTTAVALQAMRRCLHLALITAGNFRLICLPLALGMSFLRGQKGMVNPGLPFHRPARSSLPNLPHHLQTVSLSTLRSSPSSLPDLS